MNIIVKTSSGHITVRPDTTWEKDNEDFYPPEFVDELTYSFLPTPMFSPQRLEEDGRFSLFRNEVELFTFDHPSLDMIEDTLVEATKLLYIRTGDLIAIELSDRKPLTYRNESRAHVTGSFGQDKVLDFQIIF